MSAVTEVGSDTAKMIRADIRQVIPGSATARNGRPPAEGGGQWPESIPAEVAVPYPLEALPGPLAQMAREGAAALPCPPDFLAVPMLAICGAAIGRSRALQVKPGWLEGPRIWSAFVARPGDKKSPALTLAQNPLLLQQSRMKNEYEAALAEFEAAHARFEVDKEVWADSAKKAAKTGAEPPGEKPSEPEEPRMQQIFTTDSTTEALCELLHDNPRGLIFQRDELTGWARSMDQYHGGKGGDRQSWLSFWSGAAVMVNRKGRKQPLYITNPFVSVTGCLPPDVLGEFSDERGREDGFIHRLLFAYPDPVEVTWSEAGVSGEAMTAYEKVLDALSRLSPGRDEQGNEVPIVVEFTTEGKSAWVTWISGHYRELADSLFSDALRGPWAKMDGYCASLALIVQAIRYAAGLAGGEDVDAVSVKAAAAIIAYHKAHARRVYPMLRATEDDRQPMAVLKWIERQEGRTTTARDLLRYHVGGVKRSSEARKVLCELEERGHGVIAEEAKDRLRFTLC